jgi:hypothetical protein
VESSNLTDYQTVGYVIAYVGHGVAYPECLALHVFVCCHDVAPLVVVYYTNIITKWFFLVNQLLN